MNERYKQNFLRAGALACEVRGFGKSLIVPGASYNEVISRVRQKISDLGAQPAFPPQMALNDVAAHFLPYPGEDIELIDQIIKLDIGICHEGAIGDCAVSVDLSGKYQGLIDASEAALAAAERSIRVGQPLREIGQIIEQVILSYGYTPIKNLCGHGVGPYKIHTSPSIPNFDDASISGTIQPGMTFAIEPFATNGSGMISERGEPAIFVFLQNRPVKGAAARALLVKIKRFQGLPFAIHDLLDTQLSLDEITCGLKELIQMSALAGFGPLIERAHGRVAQAENSVLVDESGRVTITTRSSS